MVVRGHPTPATLHGAVLGLGGLGLPVRNPRSRLLELFGCRRVPVDGQGKAAYPLRTDPAIPTTTSEAGCREQPRLATAYF